MRALTLTQPWATLVAIGAKRIETRSWGTAYRGPLAIHAAKGFPRWAKDTCCDPPFALALEAAGVAEIPTGVIVATCRLVSCLPTRELQENQIIEMDPAAGCDDFNLNDQERAFGDYEPGRWAWLLADIKRTPPIPATGALGLWEWKEAREARP